MSDRRKTAIVTGASQGIGAGIVKAFVERDYNVVANSRKVTQSTEVAASDRVGLVDGHIGEPATAARIVQTAMSRFGSIDTLVNNAGVFFTKPFTDYTAEDIKSLISTNIDGFLYVTQLSVKQMLAQKTGGNIVTITAALARNPIRGVTAAVPMVTKGGLETITQHLAMEYAKDGIRVNAVAPGAVYTPLHRDTPKDVMESLSPMGRATDGTGGAIDNTLKVPAVAYAGVPFCTNFVGFHNLSRQAVICLLGDDEHDWPLLREFGDRPKEWLEEKGRGVAPVQ
jgi:NAD(P)-dependent dehydrogenase (short-subunit alcohol dehydrogenase family)